MRPFLVFLALAACGEKKQSPPEPRPSGSAVSGSSTAEGLPVVSGGGFEEVASESLPTVVVTPKAILLNNNPIVTIADGVIDPAEREGGARGLKIPKLGKALGIIKPAPALQIAAHAATSYGTLIAIMFSAKQIPAAWKNFDILVRASGKLARVPIVLPDTSALADAPPGDELADPKMIVSVTKTEILVWSRSGREGTMQAPLAKLAPNEVGKLAERLADVVKKRWSGKPRPEDSNAIVLQADGDTPLQLCAEVMGAMRSPVDSKPAFSTIYFASVE